MDHFKHRPCLEWSIFTAFNYNREQVGDVCASFSLVKYLIAKDFFRAISQSWSRCWRVWLFLEYHNVNGWWYKNSMRMLYLPAMTTSCSFSSSLTFWMKRGAGFFYLFTSSLWVCPKPEGCLIAIETDVLPLKDQLSARKKRKKKRRHTTSWNGHRHDDSFPQRLHTFRLVLLLLHSHYSFLPFLRSQPVQVP